MDASAPRRGGLAVDGAVKLVEAADAAEPGGERDLAERQFAGVDQRHCRREALGLGDRDRRRPEMLAEQSPDLTLAEAELIAECLDADPDPGDLVEPAGVDQIERAAYARRRAGPRRAARRGIGTAAFARAIALRDRFAGSADEHHVLCERRPRRAHRAAKDAGRADTDEERPVGGRITHRHRSVADGGVEGGVHGHDLSRSRVSVWRFSDATAGDSRSCRRAKHSLDYVISTW